MSCDQILAMAEKCMLCRANLEGGTDAPGATLRGLVSNPGARACAFLGQGIMNRAGLWLAVGGLVICGWWFFGRDALSVERVGPRPRSGSKVVLLLHGYGARGDDLVPVARGLSTSLPDVTFLIPAGPSRVGVFGRSWIPDLRAPSAEALVKLETDEVSASVAKLWKVIDAARHAGVACQDISIGGFSLGGRMAIQVALTGPSDCQLGALIVMSGGGLQELQLPPAEGHERMRALVSQGTNDPVTSQGLAIAHHLAAGGQDVRWLSFSGAHEIPSAVRAALPKFLAGEEVGEAVPP